MFQTDNPCPFCSLEPDRIWLETELTVAFADRYPVAQGHTLVVPKRHGERFFDFEPYVVEKVWTEVARVRALLNELHKPDGFNIGLNEGSAAGQTVPHAHIHVIPRWHGDVPDPRGGIRWVIPSKAQYW